MRVAMSFAKAAGYPRHPSRQCKIRECTPPMPIGPKAFRTPLRSTAARRARSWMLPLLPWRCLPRAHPRWKRSKPTEVELGGCVIRAHGGGLHAEAFPCAKSPIRADSFLRCLIGVIFHARRRQERTRASSHNAIGGPSSFRLGESRYVSSRTPCTRHMHQVPCGNTTLLSPARHCSSACR